MSRCFSFFILNNNGQSLAFYTLLNHYKYRSSPIPLLPCHFVNQQKEQWTYGCFMISSSKKIYSRWMAKRNKLESVFRVADVKTQSLTTLFIWFLPHFERVLMQRLAYGGENRCFTFQESFIVLEYKGFVLELESWNLGFEWYINMPTRYYADCLRPYS